MLILNWRWTLVTITHPLSLSFSLSYPFSVSVAEVCTFDTNVHAHMFLRDNWMKLSAKRTNEMREMMLALTDQEGRVGMNESRSSGSGSTSETSLLKFYAGIHTVAFSLARLHLHIGFSLSFSFVVRRSFRDLRRY